MQNGLSARSSSIVESIGSSRGFDSELNPCADDTEGTTSEEELARRYHIPIPSQRDLPISWNIAPTQDVLAIRFNPESKQRTLDTLRWGLIPNWAKDPKVAYKTINARAETLTRHRHTDRRSRNDPASFRRMAFSSGKKFPAAKFRIRSA